MLLLLSLLAAAPPLTTVSERSGFTKTGRYDEVVALCDAFPRRYPGKVRCEKFGVTPEGRPMLALVASAAGTLEPKALRKRGVPIVLLQGGIHAGEIDGKDAGFLLLRELLDGAAGKGALEKVAVLFVPVFNVDGHERFGPHHRPHQRGPEEMGWRVTSQNLNLNRDYAKAESPEMAAMLRLLGRYDPILHVDLHATDGAKFRHEVAVIVDPVERGPEALRAHGRALREAVLTEAERQGHSPLPFYPSFARDDEPDSGFEHNVAPPRFAGGYWPLRNRLAILVETHSWKDYPTRVRATRNVALAAVLEAATEGRRWLQAARLADEADRAGQKEVALAFENTPERKLLQFLGYAYQVERSEVSGKKWIRYDEGKPEVWEVPLAPGIVASRTATVPEAYLVPAAHAGWVGEKLTLHGFSFEVLRETRSLEVETFRATQVELRATSYEGRQLAKVSGAWAPERREVPAGSLRVPTTQPGVALLVHLFEPMAGDSFLQWGFFNAHFEPREYLEDYQAEELARELLRDATLKAEFDARLKDPAFARSPAERLRFFHQRHPSWDERLNLYPVFRSASSKSR